MNTETQFEDIAIELDDIPPLPPLPPLDISTETNVPPLDISTETNVVTEKLNRFMFKEPLPPRKYKWLYYPTFTILVTLAELALLIWTITIDGFATGSGNPMIGPSAEALLYAGARWTPYILNRGQWWRLITAMFLHAGIVHFITNAVAQVLICGVIEIRYGTIITALIYILSGISGNVWSSIFIPEYLGVGAR